MPRITFNGKTYNDIAEMPATEREAYEQLMSNFKDENQDGIPDIFQGDVVSNIINAVASTNVVVDGQRIGGFQNLTQEQRLKLERGMSMLQKLGVIHEMPNLDGSRRKPSMPGGTSYQDDNVKEDLPDWLNSEIRSSEPIITNNSAIQDDSVNTRVLLIVIGMVLLAGFGILLFFFMQGGF